MKQSFKGLKRKQIFLLACAVFLILGVCLTAGCTSSSSNVLPIKLPSPNVHADHIDSDAHFSLGKGVYNTETFRVYNSGDGDAKNVNLIVKLVRDSGTVDDQKNIYIGKLAAGSSVTETVTLDGYIIYNYKIQWSVNYD